MTCIKYTIYELAGTSISFIDFLFKSRIREQNHMLLQNCFGRIEHIIDVVFCYKNGWILHGIEHTNDLGVAYDLRLSDSDKVFALA